MPTEGCPVLFTFQFFLCLSPSCLFLNPYSSFLCISHSGGYRWEDYSWCLNTATRPAHMEKAEIKNKERQRVDRVFSFFCPTCGDCLTLNFETLKEGTGQWYSSLIVIYLTIYSLALLKTQVLFLMTWTHTVNQQYDIFM